MDYLSKALAGSDGLLPSWPSSIKSWGHEYPTQIPNAAANAEFAERLRTNARKLCGGKAHRAIEAASIHPLPAAWLGFVQRDAVRMTQGRLGRGAVGPYPGADLGEHALLVIKFQCVLCPEPVLANLYDPFSQENSTQRAHNASAPAPVRAGGWPRPSGSGRDRGQTSCTSGRRCRR